MERTADVMETTIPKGRNLRIQDGMGVEVEVLAGTLWVTYENEVRDTVFDVNQKFRVDRNGRMLAHAFSDVQLRISYPVAAGAPRLALGGGRREFGASVFSAMFADWMRDLRGWMAASKQHRHAGAAVR